MTPYEARMKESEQRRKRIVRLSKKTPKLTHQKIAEMEQCSRAYVTQTIKAAEKQA